MTTEPLKKPPIPLAARIFLIILSYLFIVGVFQYVGMLVANVPNLSALKSMTIQQQLIIMLFSFAAMILLVFFFRKYVDNRSVVSLGFSFKNRFEDVIWGFVVAVAVIGTGSLILYLGGYIHFEAVHLNGSTLFLSFILFILIAFNEEILVRGYILNNLMDSMNKYLALVISSVIFAAFHLLNFHLSLLGILNIFLAGMLLGSSYLFTRNLWFPVSLHLFWNFFQGPVLGYSVSGRNETSLLTLKTNGAQTISGGAFGFEGSLVCSVLLILSVALLLLYMNRKFRPSELNYGGENLSS
ncbi:MAG: CPBP family intramembrane metalloprotease [Bacteroidales bacterium]|nr:CPBP family intramembrane metalloprotease [Bacteroidales bacterium]